ncbi:hypothetical protein ACFO5O_10650 [Geojedonia litorea]|uniref:Uncharacterized protein n=1 Tax=Geojedonia litorea TaxID=1268269 RepID=A0ABV9N6Z9_9FLAO
MAQRPSEGLPTPPSPPPPPGLPIDGAIPVVLIAALVYGIKSKQGT